MSGMQTCTKWNMLKNNIYYSIIIITGKFQQLNCVCHFALFAFVWNAEVNFIPYFLIFKNDFLILINDFLILQIYF